MEKKFSSSPLQTPHRHHINEIVTIYSCSCLLFLRCKSNHYFNTFGDLAEIRLRPTPDWHTGKYPQNPDTNPTPQKKCDHSWANKAGVPWHGTPAVGIVSPPSQSLRSAGTPIQPFFCRNWRKTNRPNSFFT